jgi:hypothetical protein
MQGGARCEDPKAYCCLLCEQAAVHDVGVVELE